MDFGILKFWNWGIVEKGRLEWWNGGCKAELTQYLNPIFHSSNIPFFRSVASILQYSILPFFHSSRVWILLVSFLFLSPMIACADYRFELIPRISVSEVYDDNINLDYTNEKSDYLTTVSPGIDLTISSANTFLSLDYAPTWVWYNEYDQYDTVRHAGTLDFRQNLAQHLRFDLTDTYTRSEQPLETDEEMQSFRRTRYTYQRNTGSASLSYQFGPEDTFAVGYGNRLVLNEDPSLDDGTIQNPFCTITYWINVKDGFELNYEYTKAIFWRDDGLPLQDDYQGHAPGITYMHRFSRHTRASVGYEFTGRNFEGDTEDYKIHEAHAGFEHNFSPAVSLNLGIGSFIQKNERSDDETGYSYDASLVTRFQRGSFTIGGRGGWDEGYLESETRGFTRYWSAETRLEYRLLEPLTFYAGGNARRNRDSTDREWENFRGNTGLTLAFLRWFSLGLDYSYAQRDDDIDTEDFKVNRVMLVFTATKPQRL